MRWTAILVLLLLPTVRGADGERILFQERFEADSTNRWEPVKFGTLTDYRLVTEGDNRYLQANAKSSSSAYSTKLDVKPDASLVLSWTWKIDHCPTNGSDHRQQTFDHAARVVVAFDTFIGPPRTINYVWANHVPTNSVFAHPLSNRARFIALESGDDRAGGWLREQRDIVTDFARLFPEEQLTKIISIGVFTDADGTGGSVTAGYDDIRLVSP